MVIGYYVHHHGTGHLARAQAVQAGLGSPVVGLSSHPRPAGWTGEWVHLARDDDGRADPARTSAAGRLHWVPTGHAGLRARMAALSAFLSRPDVTAVVVDVSVEVVLLSRLHGVPTVAVALPGIRDDSAHLLAYEVADAVVGWWPASTGPMVRGLPRRVSDRVEPLGALSRLSVSPSTGDHATVRPGTITVLGGTGGGGVTHSQLQRARALAPRLTWTALGCAGAPWVEDPAPILRSSSLIVTHAGESAVADVAAARRPAIVMAQERPFSEQRITVQELSCGRWPVVVASSAEPERWIPHLTQATALDGSDWAPWCDGLAVDRLGGVLDRVGGAAR